MKCTGQADECIQTDAMLPERKLHVETADQAVSDERRQLDKGHADVITVNSLKCRHFGAQASVLHLGSVLRLGGGVISCCNHCYNVIR